jgi:DNA/RNA endonuclease G (NUC1)
MTYIRTFLITCFIISSLFIQAQSVKIDSTKFTINHGDLTFYLDNDTASFVSVHTVTYKEVIRLDGKRSDKWHKEKPFGPYNREAYQKSGYDLGHLTPSNITSYDDSLNYHSFSLFNQAPQLAGFNRGKWSQLENYVEQLILKKKSDAIIITGVIYDNKKKTYLGKSRIKVPIAYYKIAVFNKKKVYAWMGSNVNGLITKTDIKTIVKMANENGNKLNLKIN